VDVIGALVLLGFLLLLAAEQEDLSPRGDGDEPDMFYPLRIVCARSNVN
jgi:hypothetical protein